MQHKPFYKVPLDCYLFGVNHKPEEEVTQWVLFELIRYYGYSIDQIEVEKRFNMEHAVAVYIY